MIALRRHLLRHRHLATCLVAVALLMKMLTPGGYMFDVSAGRITVELCSGMGPKTMVMAMPGMEHHSDDKTEGAAEMPCAFAGLSSAALAAADPLLLAAAIAFVILTGFRHRTWPRRPDAAYLRPPLRGPPKHI